MGRVFSFVALLAVLGVGAWYYMTQAQSTMSAGTSNPTQTVDLAGVRNDLLAMAQAERARFAMKGNYASLDQMRADGDLTMTGTQRGPYTYAADVSATSFHIVATYTGSDAPAGARTLSIDETMQISQQ
jgi:hypothetical protein